MRIIDQLVYKIKGDSTDFDRDIDKTDKKFGTFGKNVKKVMAGLGITVALKKVIDVTKQAVEDFAVFETTLAKTSTLFGDVAVDTDNLSAKVLDLSSRTGLAADSIGESLYNALSSGIPVTEDMGEALAFMESNSRLATAGFTDMDTAVSTTAKILNSYGLEVKETDRIHKILMQTQNKGITTVGELGQNLAKVTPTAAAFGVSFENVGASLATMTAQGIKTEVATTNLSGIISELGKKGTTASVALLEVAKANGMTATSMQDMLASGMSLGDVIQMMTEYANDNNMSIIDMFGSLESGKAALAISGDNITTFNQNLAAMSTKSDVVGDAFNKMQNTVSAQSAILKTQIKNLGVAFGQSLEGPVSSVLGVLNNMIGTLTGNRDASTKLKESYNNLQNAVSNYNTILDSSKGKTDAITQSMVSQAKAQLQLALLSASESYRDSNSELEKYNKTIQKSQKWIGKYEKSLSEIAQGTGYTTEQLNLMTEQERFTAIAIAKSVEEADRYETILIAREGYQEDLIEATTNLSQAEASEENFINLLTQGYITNNAATKLLLDTYPELEQKVLDNVEAYEKEQKALEANKKSIELAQKAFAAYGDADEETLKRIIKMAEGHEDSAYWAELSRLATEKLNEAIIANREETDKANKILDNHAKGMKAIEGYSAALGDSYDANSEKVSLLNSTIKALIDSGLTAEDKAVADLIAQLKALGATTEDVTAAYAEIEKSRMSDKEKAFKAIQDQADAFLKAGVAEADVAQWKSEQIQKYEDEETRKAQEEADKQKAIEDEKIKTREDAYKLLESYSLTAKEKAIADIQAQADAFIQAGVSIVDVAEWQKNELGKLQEDQTKKAKEEAEKVRKAWEDATFSMLGSVTSIWGSINQVQANANEEEIQRIEEQNATAIQAAKDRGASEEEVTELEESLQADLNDTKNKYAQEEAERNKALSTLSVILDTAKAIMQIWATPLIDPWGKGLWTGLAAGAGAAQIAAINSAPVPSYDVGSIRIPETTTATVHKDEMILTAPQAEQARREGITIAPTKNGGNSINLVIYLDGKEIARNTIDNINTGSVGTIKARVVK